MKISKALRRAAVELAGCRASFWVGPHACRYPDRRTFSNAAANLADAAFLAALALHDGYESNEDHAHVEAEAQAMLLDGWTP